MNSINKIPAIHKNKYLQSDLQQLKTSIGSILNRLINININIPPKIDKKIKKVILFSKLVTTVTTKSSLNQ